MKPVLIVIAPYYKDLARMLREGAEKVLKDAGMNYETVDVPGAFEIPAAIAMADSTDRYAGYVALGAILRGETTHYDHVCSESARGLQQLAIGRRLAIGYGILTCDTEQQAMVRADPQQGDKGGWAAKTCLRMLAVRNRFGGAA